MSRPQTVIEASWEVVNKVGGINTVVRTKAALLTQEYKQYLLVGPLFPGRKSVEFSEQPPPEHIRTVFEELRQEGIECVYGTWKIDGSPQCVLINATQSHVNLDHIKGVLWERFGIDSLRAAYDFDEPLRWSWAVGRFIELVQASDDNPIVAQFHEWMSGLGLLYLRLNECRTRTVFTTHATMLGRTISANTDINLYESLEELDFAQLAQDLHVAEKYTTEVACAQECHVFTTVSQITGEEAKYILKRTPDVLLFNGIHGASYPSLEKMGPLHAQSRERIRDFFNYYFFSHYTFDVEQSLTFFVSGRYEYRNKGLDVLTHALEKLNHHLKSQGQSKTVVVFFFIPQDTHGIKNEVLEERNAFNAMQSFVKKHSKDIVRTLLRNAPHSNSLTCQEILSKEARDEIARLAQDLEHGGNPPLVTHNLSDEDRDPIVSGFRARGLLNREEDKVKVVHYPLYLNGSDGLLDLTYTEAVAGSHLGIFPSYYEPWGYTPVEAAVMGVPAITTDLAGFGRFCQERTDQGVWVLSRQNRSFEEVSEELFEMLVRFCELDRYGRQEQRVAAKNLSALVDWNVFIKHYLEAHRRAYEAE